MAMFAIGVAAATAQVATMNLSGSVPAELNGRNDMTIRGRKFSGNSQYVKEAG